MNNAAPTVIFEHPLNEKMRVWLRVEFLLKQIQFNKIFNQDNALLYFHSLCELLIILERTDARGELTKTIELQKQKLLSWHDVEGADTDLINNLLSKLSLLLSQFTNSPKLGQYLKEDRIIASVRQRLMIPGGCCSFDLPHFYLWLQQPQSVRDQQVQKWADSLATLNDTVTMCMQLIRQSGEFKQCIGSCNFHQDNNEGANMIRIRLPLEKNIYPQVSGHKSRYSIRFLSFDEENEQSIPEPFQFELACC